MHLNIFKCNRKKTSNNESHSSYLIRLERISFKLNNNVVLNNFVHWLQLLFNEKLNFRSLWKKEKKNKRRLFLSQGRRNQFAVWNDCSKSRRDSDLLKLNFLMLTTLSEIGELHFHLFHLQGIFFMERKWMKDFILLRDRIVITTISVVIS